MTTSAGARSRSQTRSSPESPACGLLVAIRPRGRNASTLAVQICEGGPSLHETFAARGRIFTCPARELTDHRPMNVRQILAMPLRAPVLDRQLLAGVDPHRDPALELRARQVCSRRRRDRLAWALEHVLLDVGDEAVAHSAKAPIARQDVLDARVPLLDLARRLRAEAPVDPQGVLLVRQLLSDPASPLVHRSRAVSLEAALRRANAALTPRRCVHPVEWPVPGPDLDAYA